VLPLFKEILNATCMHHLDKSFKVIVVAHKGLCIAGQYTG